MEILFFLSIFCLIVFMGLATYDGAYLHLWKYELFNHTESKFEHQTHTIRALLFPAIVALLFIDTSFAGFCIALVLVLLDLLVLGLDAYSEKESRSFMNGLPKREYILHLFANSFHFAAIVLIIATRLKINDNSMVYSTQFTSHPSFEMVQLIATNILPGGIILAFIHVLLMFNFGKKLWNTNRMKITCC